jgi:hypothetical protein
VSKFLYQIHSDNEVLSKHEGSIDEISELFVNDFVNKNVDELLKQYSYTEQVETALSRVLFVQVYAQIESTNGEYVEVLESNHIMSGSNRVIQTELQYENSAIMLVLVFDSENRIAGFTYNQLPPEIEYSDKIVTKDIRFESDGLSIGATITYPESEGEFRAAVFIPGSGPTDRNSTLMGNTPLRDLSIKLAEEGIASIRFDKRTYEHGASIDPNSFTIREEYVYDTIAAFNQLSEDSSIIKDAIYLVGHSQGAYVVPMIAKEIEAAGYVLIAPPAMPIHELMIYQFEYLMSLGGEASSEEQSMLDQYKVMRDNINSLDENSSFNASELFGTPQKYWLSIKEYDPIEEIRYIEKEVLILFGSRDYQVPESEYLAYKEALSSMNNVEVKSYLGMNHLMFLGEGTPTPDEYANPGVIHEDLVKDIANFIID